jgi:hypothetical protein
MTEAELSTPPAPDFRALWETQHHEVHEMNEAQLNQRLEAFNRGRLIRKAIAIFAAIITVKIFVISLFFSQDWMLQAGLGLLAGWVCAIAITLRTSPGRHKSIEACGEFFQSLLTDERQYLAGGTIWGPLTAFPIGALIFWRLMVLLPVEYQNCGWIAGAVCFSGALIKVGFFRWHMHRLGMQIAALDGQH